MTTGASNFPPAVREKGEKGGELAAGEILASSRLTVLLLAPRSSERKAMPATCRVLPMLLLLLVLEMKLCCAELLECRLRRSLACAQPALGHAGSWA